MKRLAIALLSCGMLCAPPVWAGFDEGLAAYKAGNFAAAYKEFLKLANRGDAGAQTYLGIMYDHGAGARQDTAEAVKWYRKAAHQVTLPLNSGLHRQTIMRTFCLAAGPQTSVAQTSWD